MNRILQRVVNKVMRAFVGSGISIDEQGKLCLPDGLCPDRVHRFIELVMKERFAGPREAMHALFTRIGVSPRAVGLLNLIIDSNGDVEFVNAAKHSAALMAALPEFKQIPTHFRDFLITDLALASTTCGSLEQAVASAREAAAAKLGCAATCDAILDYEDALSDLTEPWRERVAAA
jgi:hypothetical protein